MRRPAAATPPRPPPALHAHAFLTSCAVRRPLRGRGGDAAARDGRFEGRPLQEANVRRRRQRGRRQLAQEEVKPEARPDRGADHYTTKAHHVLAIYPTACHLSHAIYSGNVIHALTHNEIHVYLLRGGSNDLRARGRRASAGTDGWGRPGRYLDGI